MQLFSSSMFNNLHHSHRHHNDNHHSFDNLCNILIIINEVSCLSLIPIANVITIKITIIVIVMIIITGRFYPSPSRMLSLLDPLLMFGILLRWPNFFGDDDDDENIEDGDVYQRFLHLIICSPWVIPKKKQ